ncbi:hypothetical protein Dda_2366 [Drechslerella dactyloides]|uniref:Uncharacterized protein n=1 Tax=Drechslerella dactyloides TaxID=74499 RepID=A0AAD6J588_DREDA|nr:hypothetical protein Dda_2366 [Drechslerella dactyloides]
MAINGVGGSLGDRSGWLIRWRREFLRGKALKKKVWGREIGSATDAERGAKGCCTKQDVEPRKPEREKKREPRPARENR